MNTTTTRLVEVTSKLREAAILLERVYNLGLSMPTVLDLAILDCIDEFKEFEIESSKNPLICKRCGRLMGAATFAMVCTMCDEKELARVSKK